MSRPPVDRSYSFEPSDDTSLSTQRQHDYVPYRDNSPSRQVQSPAAAAGYHYETYTPSHSNAPTPPLHRDNPFSDPSEHNSQYSHDMNTPYFERSGATSPYAPQPRSGGQDGGYPPGMAAAGTSWTPSPYHSNRNSMLMDHYPAQPVNPVNSDGPYNKRYSSPWDSRVDQTSFDPNDIEDDGDDGLHQPPQRRSMLSLGRSSNNNSGHAVGATAAGFPKPGSPEMEKNFRSEEAARRKKRMCFIVLGVIAVLAIFAGAIVGGILGSRANSRDSDGGGRGLSAEEDAANGDLGLNSNEIQDLLNNDDLRRVFPAMDYTPFNAQYPACLNNPPSQNNITRDMAVLSQLTKVIRLYGTDCNQTDMVLHAFDRLELDDMSVWLGVWLDSNATTNARSLRDMYTVIDRNGADRFAGVIIGNEILYREDMTTTELASIVADVRSNFTDDNIDLPIGVADLGDNWRRDGEEFIRSVDVVMSNIHPFFAGVTAQEGSGWTHQFWQDNVVALTEGSNKQNIIAEVGWPSQGGNSCGPRDCTSDTEGSVASVDNMNIFMEDFVCGSLRNGTEYFWFEAFDEPWKEQFNTADEQWEDRWGLMTPDRVLKPGLVIPDCDGQRIP